MWEMQEHTRGCIECVPCFPLLAPAALQALHPQTSFSKALLWERDHSKGIKPEGGTKLESGAKLKSGTQMESGTDLLEDATGGWPMNQEVPVVASGMWAAVARRHQEMPQAKGDSAGPPLPLPLALGAPPGVPQVHPGPPRVATGDAMPGEPADYRGGAGPERGPAQAPSFASGDASLARPDGAAEAPEAEDSSRDPGAAVAAEPREAAGVPPAEDGPPAGGVPPLREDLDADGLQQRMVYGPLALVWVQNWSLSTVVQVSAVFGSQGLLEWCEYSWALQVRVDWRRLRCHCMTETRQYCIILVGPAGACGLEASARPLAPRGLP